MNKFEKKQPHFLFLTVILNLLAISACTPTIQLDTPKEGITINMNVVVDHKISVKMDEKMQGAFDKK